MDIDIVLDSHLSSSQLTEFGLMAEKYGIRAVWNANYFDGPSKVYDYLSRYVHQVAISNYRIVDFSNGKVTFSYLDNHDKDPQTKIGKPKLMTLDAVEFIRRFVWHILPDHFIRIRHYGLHHSSARKTKLPLARQLLGLEPAVPPKQILDLRQWRLGNRFQTS